MANQNKDSKIKLNPRTIKQGVESMGSFSTMIYGIILASSISYNIGYFKYINPQIVDLITLVDYVDMTTHNILLILFAVLLFFISSLGFIKNRMKSGNAQKLMLGFFALIMSSYFFLQGISYSKFWPIIKILVFSPEWMPLFIIVISSLFIVIMLIVYSLSRKVAEDNLPIYSVSIIPIFIFFILVLAPYLGGMIEGYIESNYLIKKDYKVQAVSVTIFPDQTELKDLFIIKKIDKGMVVRQFYETDKPGGKIVFLSWAAIQSVVYKDINKISLDTQ